MQKRLLDPTRVRRIPRQFSWVDQRLVREQRLLGTSVQAWALYLFLITVADAQGLSYYADTSIGQHLTLSPEHLAHARQRLIDAELIAYRPPLYQVLSLDRGSPSPPRPASVSSPRRAGALTAMREVLRRTLGEDDDRL